LSIHSATARARLDGSGRDAGRNSQIFAPIPEALLSIGTSLIGRIVAVSTRHPPIVVFAAVVLTAASAIYLAQHFAMTADTGRQTATAR